MPETIERLSVADVPQLEDLLAISGLTSEGLRADHVRLLAARFEQSVVACAALEVLGSVGLLRSVAVRPDRRRTGLGTRLVKAIEELARAERVHRLYLLTETADTFFSEIGYRAVDRCDVPKPIRESGQFAALCPESAVVMTRDLDHSV